MLARNFKAAADLGLNEDQHTALVQVLGMLERNEIPEHKPVPYGIYSNYTLPPIGFNMRHFYAETECGSVRCIAGWAEHVGQLQPGELMELRLEEGHHELDLLFDPSMMALPMDNITTAQAAAALRNYLATGKASWREVLATA